MIRSRIRNFLLKHYSDTYPLYDYRPKPVADYSKDDKARCIELYQDKVLQDEINKICQKLSSSVIRHAKDDIDIALARGGLAALEQLKNTLKAIGEMK